MLQRCQDRSAGLTAGNRLPIAARKMGNLIGMTYNYFRVLVKVMSPEEETAMKMLSVYRKSSQQVDYH